MNRITYDDLLAHPELLDALRAQARRERSRAFGRLVFTPVARFFRHLLNGSGRAPRTEIRHA